MPAHRATPLSSTGEVSTPMTRRSGWSRRRRGNPPSSRWGGAQVEGGHLGRDHDHDGVAILRQPRARRIYGRGDGQFFAPLPLRRGRRRGSGLGQLGREPQPLFCGGARLGDRARQRLGPGRREIRLSRYGPAPVTGTAAYRYTGRRYELKWRPFAFSVELDPGSAQKARSSKIWRPRPHR